MFNLYFRKNTILFIKIVDGPIILLNMTFTLILLPPYSLKDFSVLNKASTFP